MKKEIDKLVELARKYVEAGIESGIRTPHDHCYLRGQYAGKDVIRIYFGRDIDINSVTFCNIEIHLYSDKIFLPFDVDKAHLESVYNDALEFYSEYFKK